MQVQVLGLACCGALVNELLHDREVVKGEW